MFILFDPTCHIIFFGFTGFAFDRCYYSRKKKSSLPLPMAGEVLLKEAFSNCQTLNNFGVGWCEMVLVHFHVSPGLVS